MIRKAEGETVAGLKVMAALKTENLVLATMPGTVTLDWGKLNVIKGTVGSIVEAAPPPIAKREGSGWAWVECPTPEMKEKLLAVKIVWNIDAKSFIVFRKPRVTPYVHQALEFRGLRTEAQWLEAKEKVIEHGKESGLTIIHSTPKKWEDANTERKVLVVKLTKPGYQLPDEVYVEGTRGKGKVRIEVGRAPRCLICAGEDHHLAVCEYGDFVAQKRRKIEHIL
jgi:hypothetical protein